MSSSIMSTKMSCQRHLFEHEGVFVDVQKTFVTIPSASAQPSRSASCPPPQRRSDADQSTTLMLRGVPLRLKADKLMAALDETGISYNYLYIPKNPRTKCCKGMCFVNAASEDEASLLQEALRGVKPTGFPKKLQVLPAAVQGIKANLQQIASSEDNADHIRVHIRENACSKLVGSSMLELGLEDAQNLFR